MAKKNYCCNKNKKQNQDIRLGMELNKEENEKNEKLAKVNENFRLLRQDLYQEMMKPFFSQGHDYKEFAQYFLKEDISRTKATIKHNDPQQKTNQSFCKTYIIIDPQTSRTYQVWEFIFLICMFIEFFLVPYTSCNDPEELLETTWTLEFIIDIIWFLNMILCFCTAFKRDTDLIMEPRQIACRYITDSFLFDLLSTMPTMCTYYYYPDLYYFKFFRILRVGSAKKSVVNFLKSLEGKCNISKQTVNKIEYFSSFMIVLILVMHIVSCMWIYIGLNVEGSWLVDRGIICFSRQDIYIQALYWVVTTLTTVGYGDIKGFTSEEYMYTIVVEFIGIAFFSFIMGAINNVLLVDNGASDIIESKLEQVDVWLVKLDNSRMSKSLPKILYDKIKLYIMESLKQDHKKLIEGYDFLFQLKPSLRYKLIMELFGGFYKEFNHIFKFENFQAGEELISYFISSLYCRVFISNQTMVKKGENFSELYMIFKGMVTVSLHVKDENEFFTLYSTNYFGDYQILLGLRSSECYKSSMDRATYTHCLKKKDLLDLMTTFPEAKAVFTERARKRRIEIRRIKKQFEMECDIHPDPVEDAKEILDENRFKILHYPDENQHNPAFLSNPNYYLQKLDEIPEAELEKLSDSEVYTKQTQEEIDKTQKLKTQKSLQKLEEQLKATNNALVSIKNKLQENSEKTIDFLKKINEGDETVQVPQIINLQNCLTELHNVMQTLNNKQ